MQMILLMSVISASGFTLVPELPDLIATVGQVFHGTFYIENGRRMVMITIIKYHQYTSLIVQPVIIIVN